MIRNYVIVKITSYDNDDPMKLIDICQMPNDYNDGFDIDHPKNNIAANIYNFLKDIIHPGYVKRDIRKLLDFDNMDDGKSRPCILKTQGTFSTDKVVIYVDNDRQQYICDITGSYNIERVYQIYQIDDEYLKYVVPEHIVGASVEAPLITKYYHELFSDYESALRYRDYEMSRYFLTIGNPDYSGFKVFAVDSRNYTSENKWYTLSLQCARAINKFHLDPLDYKYISDINVLSAVVEANTYDELPLERRAEINRRICRELYPYIDQDRSYYVYNKDFDSIDNSVVEHAADDIMLLALLSADSEERFDEIHDKIYPYTYRLKFVTDSYYRDHHGTGMFLMRFDGRLKWYSDSDSFVMNEWAKSSDNQYLGKFQLNDGNILLCLDEYHPEMIVQSFPMSRSVTSYVKAYNEEQLAIRMQHHEMKIVQDEEYYDLNVCVGDWYPFGCTNVQSVLSDTKFPLYYNKYVFNEDQCRHLLSGEIITINDYMSKSGQVVSIQGKLGENDGIEPALSKFEYTFVRTDLGGRNRRLAVAELEVVEEGIPIRDED